MKKDNWKHRSSEMSCATCMAFVEKESESKKSIGRCRNHSPSQQQRGWPVMFAEDWCLDHKLDETKL